MQRCCICDETGNGGLMCCQLCKSVRFCSKSCESTAAERGHIERCVVIRRLPAASEALKRTMLDNCVLDDESLSNFCEQNWLGDENIEFYWDLVATHLNPTYIASDILFVPPAAVMLAHFLTAKQLSEPDNFGKNLGDIHKMQLVIMAVNNAEKGLDGGTHWGCLIYCRPLNQFRYYDSMRGQNSRSAKAFAEKFSMALGAQGAEFMDETGAPQQANSYDCGVYTMVVGEIIACYFNATGNIAPTSEIAAKMNRPSHGGQLSRADDTRKNAFMAGKGAP